MRVTNQMMTNNMLTSINKNKVTMSQLENQYSTGKKIQKPSDDPIVAVRALKLRTTLTEIDQYLERNIPDAQSWMERTDSALTNVQNILKQMNTYCVQGSQDTLTADNRNSILQNLTQLKHQVYSEGNAEYAGRYIFTGFKTDTTLTYTEAANDTTYKITENFKGSDLELMKTVVPAKDNGDGTFTAASIKETSRIQLSYNSCDPLSTALSTFTYKDNTGTAHTFPTVPAVATESMTSKKSTDADAYHPGDDEVYFLQDTGELVLGKNIAKTLSTATDISFSYEKTEFEQGDLRPENYFNCVATKDGKSIAYKPENQAVTYEVNFSQSIQVNTQGRDAISADIGRIVDDIQTAISNVKAVEDKIASIDTKLKDSSLSDQDISKFKAEKEALQTELALNRSVMQETFARGISVTQNQQDFVNVASSDLGSRLNRLALTQSRLEDQQVQFEDLKSINEDADLVETIVKYNSADAIYTASLSASAKVVKNTLLDFL